MFRRFDLRQRLLDNPVISKELRNRMRGFRAYAILTVYLVALSGLVAMIYLGFEASDSGGAVLAIRQALGKTLFGTAVGFQLVTLSFIAPALTAGAISAERENQTFDLVRTTLLPARALVLGKLNAALLFVLLLQFASLPLTSLAFLFGGVTFTELAIGTLILTVTAVLYCAVGIFFSSFTARTLVSTVLSYAFTTTLVFGLPFVIFMFAAFFGATLFGSSSNFQLVQELLLGLAVYLMIAVNPLATAIVSEVILLEEGSAFYFMYNLNSSLTLPVPSPWILYVVLYAALSALLVASSVVLVKRLEL